jgi:regulator of RNase E activity RraA
VFASNPQVFDITVFYSIAGTAILGSDYTLTDPVGIIVIPAGQTSASIDLTALPDSPLKEKKESVKITLVPGADYVLPKKKAARTVNIKLINVH